MDWSKYPINSDETKSFLFSGEVILVKMISLNRENMHTIQFKYHKWIVVRCKSITDILIDILMDSDKEHIIQEQGQQIIQ